MISKFFIDRPIFATVIAILMVLALIIDIAAALVGKYFQRRRSI